MPELSASRVLEQISPTDRGSMLQTLLLASARQEAGMDLWAVAGPYLVKVEKMDLAAAPAGGVPRMSLTPLPPTLGPLRSVQPALIDGRRVLLVGARSGVLLVRPGDSGEPTAYGDAAIDSALGFSRVVYQPPHGDAPLRWSVVMAMPASSGGTSATPPLPSTSYVATGYRSMLCHWPVRFPRRFPVSAASARSAAAWPGHGTFNYWTMPGSFSASAARSGCWTVRI